MKLVTFQTSAGEVHIGALAGAEGEIVDLTASDPTPQFASMLALIDAGEAGSARARELVEAAGSIRVPLSAQRLLAPLPRPRQLRDFLAFEAHLRQARANRHLLGVASGPSDPRKIEVPEIWYRQPIYYKGNRFSVVGPDADIEWPRFANILDYELELGFVIGKKGKDIPASEAMEHVFGYCIFNDISARDAQIAEMAGQLGPAKGKDFDTGNVLGPWLVTRDEIPDPYALEGVVRVNGAERSRARLDSIHHTIADMIAHVSRDETIFPGEVMGTGTVGGGSGLEQGRMLEPGDEIELEITGLGRLRNRIVSRE